jgi:hypothetical protein
MVEPVSIVAAVGSVLVTTTTTARNLRDLITRFNNAPTLLSTIATELDTIQRTFTVLNRVLVNSRTITEDQQILEQVDQVVINSATFISRLDIQVQEIQRSNRRPTGFRRIMRSASFVWNENDLRETQHWLDRQVRSLQFFLQVIQM